MDSFEKAGNAIHTIIYIPRKFEKKNGLETV